MKQVTLPSFSSILVLVLGVVGCAPEDNLVGSRNVAGAGSAGTDVGIGGATQGLGGATQGLGGTTPSLGGVAGHQVGGTTSAVGGSTSKPEVCTAHEDIPSNHSIEIVIKNDRSTPVYVGNRHPACFDDQSFRLYDVKGDRLWIDPAVCTCSDLMEYGSCKVYACSLSPLHRVEANGTLTLTWNGRHAVGRELPTECLRSPQTDTSCNQLQPADPGKYKLVITGSTEWGCAEGWDPAACECMNTNSCNPTYGPGLEGRGTLLEPSVEFDYATTNQVMVTFTDTMTGS
jgi:hypothetical protein